VCYSPPEATEDPAFYPAFKARLAPYVAELRKHGLEKYAYLYGFDEREERYYKGIDDLWRKLKADFPRLPLMTTAMMYRDLAAGVTNNPYLKTTDWFCPLTDRYDAALSEKLRKEGKQIWWYVCCGPWPPYANMFVECQAIESRILMGAQSVKYRPDGFLYWHTSVWNSKRCIESGPFTDWNPRSFRLINGDGSWACPGPDGTPVPTIRLENFRDGLEDYAYARILEAKLAARTGKDDSWSRRAKELLAVSREIVDTLTNYTDDPAVIYRWRDAMADLIDQAPGR
jgi:hypothetical protein